MNIEIKNTIVNHINAILNEMNINDTVIVEKPKNFDNGDFSVPCFTYSKILKRSPIEIAKEIESKIDLDIIEKTEVLNGYINIFLNKSIIRNFIINEVFEQKENFCNVLNTSKQTITMDYSSPNIAKAFGIGHLRSTVIGNAIKNIYLKLGHNVISLNYLGDYGTQFGKIICAIHKWGDMEVIKKNPVFELQKLYIKFHEEEANDESLKEEAKHYFKLLSEKDKNCVELWSWIRKESIKEFMKTYKLLDIINFDSYDGEAAYSDKCGDVVNELIEKNLLVFENDIHLIPLDDMPPALIQKNDGTSLYLTRDIAAIIDRKNKYNFDKMLYVIGNEQKLHVKQLSTVIEKMGYDYYDQIEHVNFGLILEDNKKMSTRRGKTKNLHGILENAIEEAKLHIQDKNENVEELDDIARKIGVGAVIFNDLKTYRENNVEFNLNEILKFEGETGPYIQYTCVRIKALLKNQNIDYKNINNEINSYQWNIISKVCELDEILNRAAIAYDPSLIAKFAISLSREFNKYYGNIKFISENTLETNTHLVYSNMVLIVLTEAMRILGISIPNKM